MKRLLTLAAMFLCCIATSFAQFSGSGSGTENDPYLILNPIQLNQLRNFLNQSNVYFKLMANIDLTEYIEDEYGSAGWMPVGNSSSRFKGILDGNGKAVTGLTINRENMDYVGLFGDTDNATIKNLTVQGNVKGKKYVGGITGELNSGKMTNCTFEGKIVGDSYVGGLSGQSGTYTDCISKAKVTGTGDYIGGIVGRYGQFTNCIASDIVVNGHDNVGGICGYSSSSITSSFVSGSITANNRVGGLVGTTNYNNTIKSCVIGHISATGNYIGGIVGYAVGNINNCYFSGSVVGGSQVGGLVGYQYDYTVSQCYTTGRIAGKEKIGGLVGEQVSGRINTSAAINTRVTATKGSVARIVGEIRGGAIGTMGTADENKSYNRTIVIDQGVAQEINDDLENGTGVSATTLKLKATYAAMGWDFTDIWAILETECFPYFKTQTAPPVITSQVVSGATTISGKCVDGGTITLEIDGVKQQMVSSGNTFSFTVSPLQAGHEVCVSAKADGKEQSYFTTEVVSFLGKGTEADPYQISTAADLTQVYRKGYYKLMNDIDLTDYINQFSPTEGWQSIGRDGSETIHFDGNGHKITGLWCNSTRDNTGLFSCFANGVIKNLAVETSSGKPVKGGANTGILIGKMINGTIENCKVTGSVADGTPIGGIVGLLDGGKILECQASVTITCEGKNAFIGGLVGELSGDIEQSFSKGTLTCTGETANIGGLVGMSKTGSNITNSYSTALVNSTYCAAGIVANNYGVVDKCYASGNMSSKNYGAGVVGYNIGEGAVVKNCVALNKKLDVVYEAQSAQSGGYGQRIIGGIKNSAPAPEMNNYALKTMQVSVNDVPQKVYDDIMNGTAKSGVDLMAADTYRELGWDFTSGWKIDEGSSYPYLISNEGGADPSGDPEPQQPTTEDFLSVDKVTMRAGENTTINILLNNKATDYTAYQFDLTLPAGFSIAKNAKGKLDVKKGERYEDDTQQLTVELLDETTNTYRFISFSMSNGIIEGTEGSIIQIVLNAGDAVEDGDYSAKIKNVNFTSTDGRSSILSDATFTITINSVILGDANGDGIVNVTDIVEIVNYILNKPTAAFIQAAADVNQDGSINVTDIVYTVSLIMSSGSNNALAKAFNRGPSVAKDYLSLHPDNDNQTFVLCLDNESKFVASQFDIHLSAGQSLSNIELIDNRSNGHVLTWSMVDDNTCRVVIYSMNNSSFEGSYGDLLKMEFEGNGNVVIDEITFVTLYNESKMFSALVGGTTGINSLMQEGKSDDVYYDLNGRKYLQKPTTKGLYIVNGSKYIAK